MQIHLDVKFKRLVIIKKAIKIIKNTDPTGIEKIRRTSPDEMRCFFYVKRIQKSKVKDSPPSSIQ